MDELLLLRTLREDVTEPSDDRLAPARARLERAMAGDRLRTRRAPRARWVAVGVAAAAVGALVAGNVVTTAQTAHAATVLDAAATAAYRDAQPGPGQYLLSHTHARWPQFSDSATTWHDQTIDVYVPADAGAPWVLRRDWGDQPSVTGARLETLQAVDGRFYGASWLTEDLSAVPSGSGEQTLAWFDARYQGGSASRDEDDFVRITDLLRSGLVPAPLRASLLRALALIPGVTSTDGVANLDGVVGVAIGRTEPLRFGLRQEVIVDPATGLVIGERQVSTRAVYGFGVDQVVSVTAVTTSVVDSAPTAAAAPVPRPAVPGASGDATAWPSASPVASLTATP